MSQAHSTFCGVSQSRQDSPSAPGGPLGPGSPAHTQQQHVGCCVLQAALKATMAMINDRLPHGWRNSSDALQISICTECATTLSRHANTLEWCQHQCAHMGAHTEARPAWAVRHTLFSLDTHPYLPALPPLRPLPGGPEVPGGQWHLRGKKRVEE